MQSSSIMKMLFLFARSLVASFCFFVFLLFQMFMHLCMRVCISATLFIPPAHTHTHTPMSTEAHKLRRSITRQPEHLLSIS